MSPPGLPTFCITVLMAHTNTCFLSLRLLGCCIEESGCSILRAELSVRNRQNTYSSVGGDQNVLQVGLCFKVFLFVLLDPGR